MKDEVALDQIFRLFGLDEVKHDPWGNWQAYLQWLYCLILNNPSNDKLCFIIHIRTCGITYFAWSYVVSAQHAVDFRSMSGDLLFHLKKHGLLVEELIQRYIPKKRRWREPVDYTKPLPPQYILHLWLDTEYPLRELLNDTKYNIIGQVAGEEYHRRHEEHPEIGYLQRSIISYSKSLRQEAIERGIPIPNWDVECNELLKYAQNAMKGDINIKSIRSEYSKEDKQQDRVESIIKEIQKAGDYGYRSMLKRDKLLTIALDGNLGGYLNEVTIHDLIDINRGIEKHKRKEILEIDKDADREAQEAESDITFPDTLPSQDLTSNEPIDLKNLELDIDKLSIKELRALKLISQALDEGYSFDSKTGNSIRQYLGKDYQTTMRAFSRAKTKLNQ